MAFGMTLHNKVKHLPEAMDSLLAQTYDDLAIVAVDDCSDDGTEEVMRRYEAQDDRITYIRNPGWEGMIATWKKAFELSMEMHRPEYFAWASDHDIWHPDWAKIHVAALEENPSTVLAYPKSEAINETGERFETDSGHPFETEGISDVEHLYRLCTSTFSPGYAVYGLFRSKTLQRAGGFRRVVMPDRFLLYEIGAHGTIRQLPQNLWTRRFFGAPKPNEEMLDGQRRVLFGPGAAPIHSYCPFMSHVLNLLLNLSVFPAEGNYSNFFKGLFMTGLLWERRKSRIRRELELLREVLGTDGKFQADADSPREVPREERSAEGRLAVRVASALESLGRTGVDGQAGQSGLLDCIVLALMTNRDRVIHDQQTELQGRKSSVFKLKKEMAGLRQELDVKTKETTDLRHELDVKTKMLSIYEKLMQDYKPNIPGRLLSLCKKLVKASREV